MNKKYCPISNSHELLCLQFIKEEEEEESEEDEGKGRKYRVGWDGVREYCYFVL